MTQKQRTFEERRIRGLDARALLDNRLFKDAFAAVDSYIDQQTLSCPPDDATRAQRIIISKQLLQAVRREIERAVTDGDVADIQIREIEKQPRFSIFRR